MFRPQSAFKQIINRPELEYIASINHCVTKLSNLNPFEPFPSETENSGAYCSVEILSKTSQTTD